jgi:hypothetical protein
MIRCGSIPKNFSAGGNIFRPELIQRQTPSFFMSVPTKLARNPLAAAAQASVGLINSCIIPTGNVPPGNAVFIAPNPKSCRRQSGPTLKPSSERIVFQFLKDFFFFG